MRTARVPTARFSIFSGVYPCVTPLIETAAPAGSDATTRLPTIPFWATTATGTVVLAVDSSRTVDSAARRGESIASSRADAGTPSPFVATRVSTAGGTDSVSDGSGVAGVTSAVATASARGAGCG